MRLYRKWTLEQKRKIVAEVDAAKQKNAVYGGSHVEAVLDRYFITTSHITQWRRLLAKKDADGQSSNNSPDRRGDPSSR